ncbi:uncharacterized protein AMSG_11836 [Thecamonas trahens ATCC 50062]|uniref:Sushi domain-containing protein n=1 Tax=Thecamonas trahens ATCC 50062 TaxID=461836 RepID=A0A0L0D8V8_THETB|nr:hypothetical protein AMSG_11836 [Thecamonas trahens ATCC 50062]KNC48511.1 hypothetical protein AMSG_11836 [Thecamonas trahens ATCC 50062]|eukprot:XP_013758671.1 hypothetical protein AMSG_11836 [Thecamonas trahens ATCC 50062]
MGTAAPWNTAYAVLPLESSSDLVLAKAVNGTYFPAPPHAVPSYPRGFSSKPGITPGTGGLATALGAPTDAGIPLIRWDVAPIFDVTESTIGVSFWFRYTGRVASGESTAKTSIFASHLPSDHTYTAGAGVPAVFPILLFSSEFFNVTINSDKGDVALIGGGVTANDPALGNVLDGHAHYIVARVIDHIDAAVISVDGVAIDADIPGIRSNAPVTSSEPAFFWAEIDAVLDHITVGSMPYRIFGGKIYSWGGIHTQDLDAAWDMALALNPTHFYIHPDTAGTAAIDYGSSPATATIIGPPPPTVPTSRALSPFTQPFPVGPGYVFSATGAAPSLTFSFSAWIYLSSSARLAGATHAVAYVQDMFSLEITPSGTLRLEASVLPGPLESDASFDLRDAAWHHVAVVQESSNTSVWIDGSVVAHGVPDLAGAAAATWTTSRGASSPLVLGANPSTGTSLCADCGLDIVTLFDDLALSSQAIFDLNLGYRIGSRANPAWTCNHVAAQWPRARHPFISVFGRFEYETTPIKRTVCDLATDGGGWRRLLACAHDASGALVFDWPRRVTFRSAPQGTHVGRLTTELQIRATFNDSSTVGGELHAATASAPGSTLDNWATDGSSTRPNAVNRLVLGQSIDRLSTFPASEWSYVGTRLTASHLSYTPGPSGAAEFVQAPYGHDSDADLHIVKPGELGEPIGRCDVTGSGPLDGFEIWIRASPAAFTNTLAVSAIDYEGLAYLYESSVRALTHLTTQSLSWSDTHIMPATDADFLIVNSEDSGGTANICAGILLSTARTAYYVPDAWRCTPTSSLADFDDVITVLPDTSSWGSVQTMSVAVAGQHVAPWKPFTFAPWFARWVKSKETSAASMVCVVRLRCPAVDRSHGNLLCSHGSGVDSECSLVCDAGFALQYGPAIAKCTTDGWQPAPLGICLPSSFVASPLATGSGGSSLALLTATVEYGSSLAAVRDASGALAVAVGDAGADVAFVGTYSATGGLDISPSSNASALANGTRFGEGVALVGDVNGDGLGDLAVLSAGDEASVSVALAPDWSVVGPWTRTQLGTRCGVLAAAGDVNSDGVPDVVVGCPDADGGSGRIALLLLGSDGRAIVMTWASLPGVTQLGRSLVPLPIGALCSVYDSVGLLVGTTNALHVALLEYSGPGNATLVLLDNVVDEAGGSPVVDGLLGSVSRAGAKGLGAGAVYLGSRLDPSTGLGEVAVLAAGHGMILPLGLSLSAQYGSCAAGTSSSFVASGEPALASILLLDDDSAVGDALQGTLLRRGSG